jgi:hypothetical protein
MRPRLRAATASWAAIGALLLAAVSVQAEDRAYGAANEVEPLAPGARVPSALVATVRGERVDLAEMVRSRGALLVFYRGGW